jgi:hypothetical protein
MGDWISSFKIARGCVVIAYRHRDYNGEMKIFAGSNRYVGDQWNDKISSWKCECKR